MCTIQSRFIPPTKGQEQQKSTPSYVLKTTKVQKTNAKGDTISTLNMRNVHKLVPSSKAAKSSEILEEILDCPRSDDEFASKK